MRHEKKDRQMSTAAALAAAGTAEAAAAARAAEVAMAVPANLRFLPKP
jgi:hypothetical protein